MMHLYTNLLKRGLLLLLIVFSSMLSFSTTYYVSNVGNDSNSGLSADLPWKTLNKVNSQAFKSGDQILFKKGHSFYGSLIINSSGAPGSPITIGAYGLGANPIITGFKSIGTWKNLGGNIWESAYTVSNLSECNMVAINGVNTPMGKTPNTSFYAVSSGRSKTSVTSTELTGSPNWTGAEIVLRSSHWTYEQRIVTSQSGNTINWSGNTVYDLAIGEAFFIQNDPRVLDIQNEWYYNNSTRKIQVYSMSMPTNVKVASVDYLVTLHGDYIKVDGLDFSGANLCAIYNEMNTRNNLTIQNCNISFSGTIAINVNGKNIVIANNTILNSNGKSINSSNSNNIIVRNNFTQNNALYGGMGTSIGAFTASIDVEGSTKVIIEYNRILNSGQCGINPSRSDSVLIKNNYIDNFGFLLDDAGGIHTGNPNGASQTGCKIVGNIILNGIGMWQGFNKTSNDQATGIYLDDNSQYWEVSDNSVANCVYYGLLFNNAKYNYIHDNTFYNNGIQMNLHDILGGHCEFNTITNNKFISKTASQCVAQFMFAVDYIPTNETLDYNYYARPIDSGKTFRVYYATLPGVSQTFASWQANSGQDAHSQQSPITITNVNDLQFEYNASKTIKVIALSQPMIDVKGTKYPSSITLQPYASAVLMKDNGILKDVEIVSSTEVTGMENQADQMKIDIFPNPGDGKFTVRFSQFPDARSRIDILDISGRKITSRIILETSENFNLEGHAAGVYFVKSIIGSKEIVQKLILN